MAVLCPPGTLQLSKKEGRKDGKKERKKERRKENKKEGEIIRFTKNQRINQSIKERKAEQ